MIWTIASTEITFFRSPNIGGSWCYQCPIPRVIARCKTVSWHLLWGFWRRMGTSSGTQSTEQHFSFPTANKNRDVQYRDCKCWRIKVQNAHWEDGNVHTNHLQVLHSRWSVSRSQLNAEWKNKCCMGKGLYLVFFKPFVRNSMRRMKTKKMVTCCIFVVSAEIALCGQSIWRNLARSLS